MKTIPLISTIFVSLVTSGNNLQASQSLETLIQNNIDDSSILLSENTNLGENIGQMGGTSFSLDGGETYSLTGSAFENISQKYAGVITSAGQSFSLRNFKNADGNVSVSNFAGRDGSFIKNSGNFTADNVSFTNNGDTLQYGGVIYNNTDGHVTVSNSEFEKNTAQYGGAIYNIGEMTISNTSINNSQTTSSGGAIFNKGNIVKIGGAFDNNQIYGHSSVALNGGAIYNTKTMGEVIANFTNNSVTNVGNIAAGGAIYDSSTTNTITKISGNFNKNSVTGSIGSSAGGAIYSQGKIGDISGNFTQNYVYSTGPDLSGLGLTGASGGAISAVTIDSIHDSTFTNNYVLADQTGAQGGAINLSMMAPSVKEISNTTFNSNSAVSDNGDAKGGAIMLGNAYSNSAKIDNILNTSFINNFAEIKTAGKKVLGGAIASYSDLTITANNATSLFSGNYVKDAAGLKTNNAISFLSSGRTLNLAVMDNGKIQFDDMINADSGASYVVKITGNDSGEVILNNAMKGAGYVAVYNGTTLTLGNHTDINGNVSQGSINGTKLYLYDNSVLNLENNDFQDININQFYGKATTGIKFDADLSTGQSDTITADKTTYTYTYTDPDTGKKTEAEANSKLAIKKINIMADGEKDITLFANGKTPDFANLDTFAAFTADYKYTFSDDNKDGVLSTQRKAISGLNGAIADTTTTRSYSVSDAQNVKGDLGSLGGVAGTEFTIIGNDKILSGAKNPDDIWDGYAGMIVADQQTLNIENAASIESFRNSAEGGFIKNSGNLNIENSSFKYNVSDINGGAIWSDKDVNITANNGGVVEFSDNYGGIDNNEFISNDIYMADAGATLNLNAVDNSSIEFNSGINGVDGYGLSINGNNSGSIRLNQSAQNVGEVTMNGAKLYAAQDNFLENASVKLNGGELHFDNRDMTQKIHINNLTGGKGTLHIDVDTFNRKSDVLDIGTLTGNVNLVGHLPSTTYSLPYFAAAQEELDGMTFANVQNNNGAFNILRVEGSAYAWDAQFDNITNQWAMFINRNTNTGKPLVTAESIAYMGLNSAGMQQTNSMIRNIENKTETTQQFVACCGGYYDKNYNGIPLYSVWASPVYENAKVDRPVKFESDITGLEAGGDVQISPYDRVGVFASYRHGKYELDGRAENYSSETGSDINIDSYILGLYYKYTNQTFWTMATVFGGIQDADIKTKDGISADTDGMQFGGSISGGYGIPISTSFIIEPTIRTSYTYLSYDDIVDAFNKTAEFDNSFQAEIEAGVKFVKTIYNDGFDTKLHFKPSVIQTITDGDKVHITGLNTVNSLKNQTLGRAEVGISGSITERIHLYGSTSYTYGKDYRDASINAGLNYAF